MLSPATPSIAGIQNALFFADNCRMLYGDGQEMAGQLIQEVKGLQF